MPVNNRAHMVRAYGEEIVLPRYRVRWLARIVYSHPFELFIAFVIICNAIALAILTEDDLSPRVEASANALDNIAYSIFVIEVAMRLVSYGRKPWRFFLRGWNVFDFIIIALSPFFAGQTIVLRLLRLLRLVRIVRFLPEVRVLTRSIMKSMPPLISLAALIGLLLFMFGMVGHYLFSEEAPQSWGSIGDAMLVLFILLTLEDFPFYFAEAFEITPLALPYFMAYIFIIVFTVLNVLIGIVLNAMDEARVEAKAEADADAARRATRKRPRSERHPTGSPLSPMSPPAPPSVHETTDARTASQEIALLRDEIALLRASLEGSAGGSGGARQPVDRE